MSGNGLAEPSVLGRPLSSRAIVIGGALVGLVGAAAIAALLYLYGGDTDHDRARLDLVRTAGTLVAGTGGLIALLLAARRQRSTELTLVQQYLTLEHQREVATTVARDAVEQRITELYARAVEQLGNDQAPVRLGGLYALERLAQNNPTQRQTTVDVICAYLRMPYTPPDDKPSVNDASTELNVYYEQRRQEMQVRLTAQRILTAHLRPTTAEVFWPDIDLDLTEGYLYDFDLARCHVRNAKLSGAQFSGVYTQFDGAQFSGQAWFTLATFSAYATFNGVQFFQETLFSSAKFSKVAHFDGAQFSEEARFDGAQFSEGARFDGTQFSGWVRFDEAQFSSEARFCGAQFAEGARFVWAQFSGASGDRFPAAEFSRAQFSKGVDFGCVEFSGNTSFEEARFSGDAGFSEARFGEKALFDGAEFSGYASFEEARFSGDAGFNKARFSRDAQFSKTQFFGDAGFREVQFAAGARFDRVEFSGKTWLAVKSGDVELNGARVRSVENYNHLWPAAWAIREARGGEENGWLYLLLKDV